MTGFFRTFVPQCCNHGAEFFRPPQKCHKSASGKNSLYCKSGILSPATGARHSPVRQRGNRDYRTGWRGGGDARWGRSPRGFVAAAPDKVGRIAELALYNLKVILGRVLLRKGVQFRNPSRIGIFRNAGRGFDLLAPSGAKRSSILPSSCRAPAPLSDALCLVPLRQIHGDFLLSASAADPAGPPPPY